MNLTICFLAEQLSSELISKVREYEDICREVVLIVGSDSLSKSLGNIIVIKHKFNNDFASLRNFALLQIKTDWVFFLDSDEKLDDELVQRLPSLIEARDVDGYWIPRRTYIAPNIYLRYGLFYPDYQLRLFRIKPEYTFVGKVHEIVNIPQGKTKTIKGDILHFPRNPKYTKFSDLRNLIPYIKIDVEDLKLKKMNKIILVFVGINKGVILFLNGFFRGKGFLDGWAGFRAHILFSLSIGLPYILAALKKR